MLIKLRELRRSLVGQTQRIRGEGEGLTPVTAGLSGEEDGRDLGQGVERLRVVVLHGGAVNEDQIRVSGTDGLEVGGTDRAEDRDVSGAVEEVVGDGLLAAARHDADGGHAQGQRVVRRGLRQGHDAARVSGKRDLLAGGVGDGAALGARRRFGGRGRGGLRGRAGPQRQGCQGERRDGADSCRDVHVFLDSNRSQ